MNKLITFIVLLAHSSLSLGDQPYAEELEPEELINISAAITLVELTAGSYDRKNDQYLTNLSVISNIKGESSKTLELSHQHGWNRLENLGGYYLLFLDSSSQLILTGSAIIPIVSFGGPFLDTSLENVAQLYELPNNTWFTYSDQLWALKNCVYISLPTCEREKELVAIAFNKANQSGTR